MHIDKRLEDEYIYSLTVCGSIIDDYFLLVVYVYVLKIFDSEYIHISNKKKPNGCCFLEEKKNLNETCHAKLIFRLKFCTSIISARRVGTLPEWQNG